MGARAGWAGAAIPHAGRALTASVHGLSPSAVYSVGATVLVVAVAVAVAVGRRAGRRALGQRLTALGTRLGIDTPDESSRIETSLAYLEQVTGAAAEAVAESSADAIRLRRAPHPLPPGVVLCGPRGPGG